MNNFDEDAFVFALVAVSLGGAIYMVISNWLFMRKMRRKLDAIDALYAAEKKRQGSGE